MKVVPYRKTNEKRPMSNMLSLFDEFFNRFYDEEGGKYNFRAMPLILWSMIKITKLLQICPDLRKTMSKSYA